ncbi:MAG: alpha/beta hydrolase [archaeon]|nr:alpha/beta hydrolase [archaeon]
MPTAAIGNNINIEYDTFGDSSAKPILMIQGLRMQMIRWTEDFLNKIADRGFYVIRFDNRDVGLSTKFDEERIGKKAKVSTFKILKAFFATFRGKKIDAPYTLLDMAKDAIGVLDHLKIDKAHICGASMGSAISQIIAYRHKDRILSLCSIMGSTGNPKLPKPSIEAIKALSKTLPEDREGYIKEALKIWKFLSGPVFPFDEQGASDLVGRMYDRMNYPPGGKRQLLATISLGDQRSDLATIEVPTVVIHGSIDPLVPVEGGKDTAKSIPNAELLIIEGMGHSIPEDAVSQVVEAITINANKVNME